MKKQKYDARNVYIITTYKCNSKCGFCIFRKLKSKEDSDKILGNLEKILNKTKERLSIKITGGEPFLKIGLLNKIVKLCNNHKNRNYIKNIGIGTNGTIPLPNEFNKTSIKINIYLSRHNIGQEEMEKEFHHKILSLDDLSKNISNPLITFNYSCNLIKGGIDSINKIIDYINLCDDRVNQIVFRELNHLGVDNKSTYEDYVYDYIKYYSKHIVPLSKILPQINKNPHFKPFMKEGNYYDENYIFIYKKKLIKFRKIDEQKLVEYNKKHKDVDEYTIHPDGYVSGCWNKDKKLMEEL